MSQPETLQSYLCDAWQAGAGAGASLVDPVTGAVVATASSVGLDLQAALVHGRTVGAASLAALTFAQRGDLLEALAKALHGARDRLIEVERRNGGCTRGDAKFDIDGASGTLMYYAALGRELGHTRVLTDGEPLTLGRSARLQGQHIRVARPGVAVLINAFNFPCWGLAEKAACALLAGMPVLCKPATATAWATQVMVQAWTDAGLLPAGALQLLCGGVGDLLDHLTWADVIAFTGSADTAATIRRHPRVAELGLPVNVEADSLNAAVLLPGAEAGTYDAFLRDVHLELTQKAGQKCTAVRRIVVPRDQADAVITDLGALLDRTQVGDPADEAHRMGPLATPAQRRAAEAGIAALRTEADVVYGDPEGGAALNARHGEGACFVTPLLLRARAPHNAKKIHEIEVFGPVATVIAYDDVAEAVALVRRGEGSLVTSIYGDDREALSAAVLGLAAWHGRLVVVDAKVADKSIPPGTVMPHLLHGGPGRAGGGEELGTLRGLNLYTQRCAIQGNGPLLPKLIAE